MRKIQVVALSALAAIGVLVTSCDGGVSTNASLNNPMDTLSYAMGAYLYESGLNRYLAQKEIVSDTSAIFFNYKRQIEADSSAVKKAELEKEMRFKIDSVMKLNNRNISEFLKGLQEGINAPESKSAYMEGLMIGKQTSGDIYASMKERIGLEPDAKFNNAALVAAMANSIKGKGHTMSEPGMVFTMKMQAMQEEARQKEEARIKEQSKEQVEAGEKFLAENKTKEGVVTLPSGLQYKVIKEGNGDKPKATDMVTVHYHGTLIDGSVFDSSVERKDPAKFNVSGVIKGWTEALQLMPVGSKWQLYVPADLAYGAQDMGKIKPFSTLIFDVELISIDSPNK
jgi:FKBP-type peptidyl-prolyl cis-trans isomerase FklB